jgi:hypothetical protein
MVVVMEELIRLKNYQDKTFFCAAYIADSYIRSLSRTGQEPLCLMNLAACAVTMAAKLEEPAIPSFKRMVSLVEKECGVLVTVEDLTVLEEDIVRELDFNLSAPFPETFLERFLRVFGMDEDQSNFQAKQVSELARFFIKKAIKSANSRKFTSAQIAAAGVMLAINLSKSPAAYELSLSEFTGLDQ